MIRYVTVVVALGLLAGCGGQNDTAVPQTASLPPGTSVNAGPVANSLHGQVWSDQLEANARVTVLDAAGRNIEALPVTTGGNGWFRVRLVEFPARFTVVAQVGPHEYRSEYENFDARNMVQLNPATTIHSAYARRHPELSLEECARRVRAALRVPPGFDLRFGLNGPHPRPFSSTTFQRAAAARGARALSEELAAQIDSNTARKTAIAADIIEVPPADWVGPITEEAPTSSVLSALSHSVAGAFEDALAGELVGWALSALGVGPDSDTDAQLQQVQSQLVGISQQLTTLSASIANSTALVNYNTTLQQSSTGISTVQGLFSTYTTYTGNPSSATPALVGALANAISTQPALLTTLGNSLLGTGATPGLAGQMTQPQLAGPFLFNSMIDAFYQQISMFANFQAQAVLLLTNANNFISQPSLSSGGVVIGNLPPIGANQALVTQAYNQIQQSASFLPVQLPDSTVVLDPTSSLLWSATPLGPDTTDLVSQSFVQSLLDEESIATVSGGNLSSFTGNYGVIPNWQVPTIAQLQQLLADAGGGAGAGNSSTLQAYGFNLTMLSSPRYVWAQTGSSGELIPFDLDTGQAVSLQSLESYTGIKGTAYLLLVNTGAITPNTGAGNQQLYFSIMNGLGGLSSYRITTTSANGTTGANANVAQTQCQAWPVFTSAGNTLYDASQSGQNPAWNQTANVYWTSSNPAVATVSNAPGQQGLVTWLTPGTTVINCASNYYRNSGNNSFLSGSLSLSSPTLPARTLQRLYVAPSSTSFSETNPIQFASLAQFSDGTTQIATANTTWTSSDPLVAFSNPSTPNVLQILGAPSRNPVQITATFQNVTTTTSINVNVRL